MKKQLQAIADALPEPAPESWRGNRVISCGQRTAKQLREAWAAIEEVAAALGCEVDDGGHVVAKTTDRHPGGPSGEVTHS